MGRLPNPVRALEFPYRAPSLPADVDVPPDDTTTGANYDTEWARTPASRAVRRVLVQAVMRPGVAALARPDRKGLDRLIEVDGPVIFVANHHSHVDTPLLITSMPKRFRDDLVVGAAADHFFGTTVSSALAALTIGAIPIERTKVGRTSSDLAASLVYDGWNLLLYPEGGRSPDGWGQPFRGGAAYLAVKCGVPVVPVHIAGTGRILRKDAKRPHPSRTTVTFGAAVTPVEKENTRRFAARLERAVAELGDEATTDWWQARKRAHAGTTPSLTGPEASSWRRAWALGDRSPSSRRKRRRWPNLS